MISTAEPNGQQIFALWQIWCPKKDNSGKLLKNNYNSAALQLDKIVFFFGF